MHNSKNKGHIRPFYLSNDCSTVEDIYSLGYSCMWINIAELWVQTRITTTFRYDILCVLTLVTQKLQVICGHSTYRMTAILSEMSIFCVRAEFEKQKASYASKHTLQSLSDKPFFHIYSIFRDITWKLSSYMDFQDIKRMLYYRRHSLCGLELH